MKLTQFGEQRMARIALRQREIAMAAMEGTPDPTKSFLEVNFDAEEHNEQAVTDMVSDLKVMVGVSEFQGLVELANSINSADEIAKCIPDEMKNNVRKAVLSNPSKRSRFAYYLK